MTYHTIELPQEHAACGHCTAALAAKQGLGISTHHSSDPKVKLLNLFTYKYHTLGDYPNTICHYGTTDSYNTQIVSWSHILLKSSSLIHVWRVSSNTATQNNGIHAQARKSVPWSGALWTRKQLSDSSKRSMMHGRSSMRRATHLYNASTGHHSSTLIWQRTHRNIKIL